MSKQQSVWKVASCPVLGIRDLVLLNPGNGIQKGIGFFRIPDLSSQTHIFESLVTVFWVKSSIILWKLAQIFFFGIPKVKKFSILWNLWLQNKVWQQNFFHPSLLLLFLDPGFGIWDPRSGIRDKHPRSATLLLSRVADLHLHLFFKPGSGSALEWKAVEA